jgi:hypothetical protein
MRALCGAIVAAGALIGLGLTAMGFGQRYGLNNPPTAADGQPVILHLSQLDRPLVFILVFLTAAAVIGLGTMFVGLAYHHLRREREYDLHRTTRGLRDPV